MARYASLPPPVQHRAVSRCSVKSVWLDKGVTLTRGSDDTDSVNPFPGKNGSRKAKEFAKKDVREVSGL